LEKREKELEGRRRGAGRREKGTSMLAIKVEK